MNTHAGTHTHTHTHTTNTHTYICKHIVTVNVKSLLFFQKQQRQLCKNHQNVISITTLELNGSHIEMSVVSTLMLFGITVCFRARYSEGNQLLNVDFNFKILYIIVIQPLEIFKMRHIEETALHKIMKFFDQCQISKQNVGLSGGKCNSGTGCNWRI